MGLFPLIGADTEIAPMITSLFPRKSGLIEVFGGSGAISLYCAEKGQFKTIIWNDLDRNIYDSFRIVKHYPQMIKVVVKILSKLSRCVNIKMRKKVKSYLREVRVKLSSEEFSWPLSGIMNLVLHYSCAVPFKSGLPLRWIGRNNNLGNVYSKLQKYHKLLQKVNLMNVNGVRLLEDNDGDDVVFYVDPPHYMASKGKTGYYRLNFTPYDMIMLDEVIRGLDSPVVLKLSINDLPYYKVSKKWRKVLIRYSGKFTHSNNTKHSSYYLFTNFELDYIFK